jgi:hypothetical protein
LFFQANIYNEICLAGCRQLALNSTAEAQRPPKCCFFRFLPSRAPQRDLNKDGKLKKLSPLEGRAFFGKSDQEK